MPSDGRGLPVFSLDDIAGIADFIAGAIGLQPAAARTSWNGDACCASFSSQLRGDAGFGPTMALGPGQEAAVAARPRSRRRGHRAPDTGIDYTVAEIARRLARDGEGELIGFDLVDKDNRPFGESEADTPAHWGGDGTLVAGKLSDAALARGSCRCASIPRDPASLARAVAFIAQTPARIVVVPMWGQRKEDWQPFRQAVERFRSCSSSLRRRRRQGPRQGARLSRGLRPAQCPRGDRRERRDPGWSRPRLQTTANWGAKTVDAVALAANSALATAVAAKAAAAALSVSPGLTGAELKLRLIEQRLAPARSGDAAAHPVAGNPRRDGAEVQPVPDPAARVLDKTRVPERLEEPIRRDKTR